MKYLLCSLLLVVGCAINQPCPADCCRVHVNVGGVDVEYIVRGDVVRLLDGSYRFYDTRSHRTITVKGDVKIIK